jgi:branched-subunit amino acid aminotransferase/4-amino-4-deoxychorismate lyase
MQKSNVIWVNGRLIDAEEFRLNPSDRGLLHGCGLFETLLCIDGRLIFADRHLHRWRQSCDQLGWQVVLPDLRAAVTSLLHANGLQSGRTRMRLSLTAGSGSLDDPALGEDAILWITVSPVLDAPLSVTAHVSPWRVNERSPLAGIKSSSYAEHLLALSHARSCGFDEALLFDSRGNLSEAATSNVFLVKDDALLTPSCTTGCLPGITRGWVMEQAARLGIPCVEGEFSRDHLDTADGIFLTSAIRWVVPVTHLDQHSLLIMPIAAELRAAWHRAVSDPAVSGC